MPLKKNSEVRVYRPFGDSDAPLVERTIAAFNPDLRAFHSEVVQDAGQAVTAASFEQVPETSL